MRAPLACALVGARIRSATMTTASPIEFFFDIGSTYSYLASTQMQGLQARTGRVVRWRPFLLGGVFKATNNATPISVAARATWLLRDAERWAEEYGIPLKFPSRFPLATLPTERALVACELETPDALPAFALALFHAYWAEDRDPSARDEIAALARSVGLDADRILGGMDTPAVKDHLRKSTEDAIARGAFGAPTFFVDGQMWFGNDRIAQMERFLGRRVHP